MKVIVSGATGFIGSRLCERLAGNGHRVVRLTRRPVSEGADAIRWDPEEGRLDAHDLEGIDAVVHLAGEGIGDHRWTESHKARVLDSRVRGTRLLAEAIASLDQPPSVLVSGSGVHYYGDRGDEELTEDSSAGGGFLAEVVQQWEASTEPASRAGIRVVTTRSGVVQSPEGGALRRALLPFKFGLGGKLGSGRQWFSWITREDEVGAIEFLLEHETVAGPVNLTAPNPVTNAEFTRVLAAALNRPAVFTVPPFALRLMFSSEMADEMLLMSLRVLPAKLQEAGYRFQDPEIEPALRRLLS